eukprot:1336804-Rhodomonas_salina.1
MVFLRKVLCQRLMVFLRKVLGQRLEEKSSAEENLEAAERALSQSRVQMVGSVGNVLQMYEQARSQSPEDVKERVLVRAGVRSASVSRAEDEEEEEEEGEGVEGARRGGGREAEGEGGRLAGRSAMSSLRNR